MRDICCHAATAAESLIDLQLVEGPAIVGVVEDVASVPTTGRVMLVDGFTVTAADTEANQKEYHSNHVSPLCGALQTRLFNDKKRINRKKSKNRGLAAIYDSIISLRFLGSNLPINCHK